MTSHGRKPTFLIVGAMRSGTTSLTSYLQGHPEVFIPKQKEIRYFDSNLERGLSWYLRHFPVSGHRAIGEASPNYMYFEHAGAEIARLLPEVKLIAILRNPVERAYSHYWLNRSRRKERLDFASAIEAEPDRLARGQRAFAYLDRGFYLSQLMRLARHFPREAIHVTTLDDLRLHPLDTFHALCRFLGIDDSYVPPHLGRSVNPYVELRWVRVRKVYRRFPKPVARVVGRLNSRRVSYPPMDPSLREELVARFEPHNGALAAWLSRDLSSWNT